MRIIRKRLRRFAELTAAERLLLWRALMVVAIVRAALWIAPLRVARKVAEVAAHKTADPSTSLGMTGGERVEKIVWAVSAASRYIPKASCLTQAVAAQALLAHAGCPSRIDVGVAKHSTFEAHAWLVAGSEIVLGAQESCLYERILALD